MSVKTSLIIVLSTILISSCNSTTENLNRPNNMGNTIENLVGAGLIAEDNDSLYYVIESTPNHNSLQKHNIRTNQIQKISNEQCRYLNISENWIYYVNSLNNQIYKIDRYGNNNQKISDKKVNFLAVHDNKLYYILMKEDGNALYCMDSDGTNVQELTHQSVRSIYFYQDKVFYIASDVGGKFGIYSMNLNGDNRQRLLVDHDISWFCVYNEHIYYVVSLQAIKKFDCTSYHTDILDEGPFDQQSLNMSNGTLYYRNLMTQAFIRLDLNTEKQKVSYNIKFSNIFIAHNKIYHYEDNELYVMNLDGTNNKKVL